MNTTNKHQITRVRRETRRRILSVTEVNQLTPAMRRIHFRSDDLFDFTSESPDDHIKVFLPLLADSENVAATECMRDYTPRKFDAKRGTLTIDFALHKAGPATMWARSAKIGDPLEIGGPRGSAIVADDFDWYLLIGDETALPAIGRRLEELRPGVPVTTLVIVNDADEHQALHTRASNNPVWIHRARQALDDSTLLQLALANTMLPPGEGYVWIAAEARVARSARTYVTETLGHPRQWVKAAGYWSAGAAATHETIQD